MITGLPKDPIMLLSVINMKLRDFYPTLEALCDDMEINQEELTDALKAVGAENYCRTLADTVGSLQRSDGLFVVLWCFLSHIC